MNRRELDAANKVLRQLQHRKAESLARDEPSVLRVMLPPFIAAVALGLVLGEAADGVLLNTVWRFLWR